MTVGGTCFGNGGATPGRKNGYAVGHYPSNSVVCFLAISRFAVFAAGSSTGTRLTRVPVTTGMVGRFQTVNVITPETGEDAC